MTEVEEMQQQPLRAREVTMGGIRVSQVAFGTEHLNQYFPAFGGQILRDAAVQNNVFFWDTDNCYGSQPTVAAGIKLLERERLWSPARRMPIHRRKRVRA